MTGSLRSAGLATLITAGTLAACHAPEPRVPTDSQATPPARTAAATTAARSASPGPAPGRYVFTAGIDTTIAPRIHRLVLEIGEPEQVDGRELQWVRVDARRGTKRLFGYEILVANVDFLGDASIDPTIARYVLYPARSAPLEYVHSRDGSPLLPTAAPRDWLPRPLAADLGRVSFLGRVLQRTTDDVPSGTWPRGSALRLALDLDFQIATSRHFRDDGTGRKGADWRWVDLSAQDYRTMVAAGFDLFQLPTQDLSKVEGLAAFAVMTTGWEFLPDLLLRGNYRGAVMHSDEPAIHACNGPKAAGARSPAEMAEGIMQETRRTQSGDGLYGRGFLAHQIEATGFRYGSVVQPPYPAWEAIASAAWYELEAGAEGWCLESRMQPAKFAGDVERAVGVAFPSDAKSCIQFHLALARGAARHFHVPWGMSVYGQMDPTAADLLFPLAYEAGATYFWMWTSDGDHHVPYARQLQLAKALRTYATEHPRGGASERTRSADVALILPWGYAVDEFTFGSVGPSVWGVRSLHFSARGDGSATHRQVLASAMGEAAALLESNTTFDILFLRDSEDASGYREVRRVGTDARVRVERP